MKIYLKIVFIAVFAISMIGYILPALFSASSNEAVALGVVLSIISPVVIFYTGKTIIN